MEGLALSVIHNTIQIGCLDQSIKDMKKINVMAKEGLGKALRSAFIQKYCTFMQ